MLVFRWHALLPERDIDWLRHVVSGIFSDYFGTLWREDEITYQVLEDHWINLPRQGSVYNPIISATFSFVAVCNVDFETVKMVSQRVQTQLRCYLPAMYKSFILDGRIIADDELEESDEE